MTKDEALTLALDALERASHSLGSFVSDHGWGQEDMNTLDSVMAAEHRIKEALAQPEQEPISPKYSFKAHWEKDGVIGVVGAIVRPDGGIYVLQEFIDLPKRTWVAALKEKTA